MDGTEAVVGELGQGLVDEPVAVPEAFCVMGLGQGDFLPDVIMKGTGLHDGLAVHLADGRGRPVCGNNEQGQILVIGFSYSRCHVEKRRTRCAARGHGAAQGLAESVGRESGTALVSHRCTEYVRTGGQRVIERRIARARAQDGPGDAVLFHESSEFENIGFDGVHVRLPFR